MAVDKGDPLIVNYWDVDFQGALKGPFVNCQLPQSANAVTRFDGVQKQGEPEKKFQPGQVVYSELTLTRGLTSNMDAWKWVKDVLAGDPSQYRKNGTISLYNQKKEKVASYDITAAWPTSVVTSGTATGGTDAVLETIIITHEGFKRTT